MYVVPFARYQLNETMPLSMMKHLDEEVPPVFMILDTYDKDIKSLLPGTHLFCVYGDNWFQVRELFSWFYVDYVVNLLEEITNIAIAFQSVKYNLKCVVAIPPSDDCVETIKNSESLLAEKKKHLENFQGEFCEIKKKYEEACKKLEGDITDTVELMEQREKAYNDYIARSAQKYSHVQGTKQHNGGGAGGQAGLLGGIGKLFG